MEPNIRKGEIFGIEFGESTRKSPKTNRDLRLRSTEKSKDQRSSKINTGSYFFALELECISNEKHVNQRPLNCPIQEKLLENTSDSCVLFDLSRLKSNELFVITNASTKMEALHFESNAKFLNGTGILNRKVIDPICFLFEVFGEYVAFEIDHGINIYT